MSKNVLVIGNGGREHAICWKISQSEHVKSIFVLPASFGISQVNKVQNVTDISVKDHPEIVKFCKQQNIDLVIVGPEDPLANGIGDALRNAGIHCFGPDQKGAKIESDKSWSKAFMDKYNIPSAKWESFTDPKKAKDYITANKALVVKASGLAAGKGVVVAANITEACAAVDELSGKYGEVLVVEEVLEGEEVSVLAFTDGKCIRPMLPAQDHKRIFENDQGANTGGMGAYCPYPFSNYEGIFKNALIGLQSEGIHYVGVLYAGLILTKDGPKVLEFNCRFGDPETQVVLPLLESDLYEIMSACCNGLLNTIEIVWKSGVSAVGVIMASRGYPETSSKGQVIKNVDKVSKLPNHLVFHSGTALKDNELVTNGGRVLITVVLDQSLALAAAKATRAASQIQFDGAQYRRDISHKGIARTLIQKGNLTYKQSGVDITTGNNLIDLIKPLAKSTGRTGLMGGLGGFGGCFDLKACGYKDPILVSGTDGVGTKLKIAQTCGLHGTIGIDLVAMCVNDVLAHGAEPLFFLDYFSCGVLEAEVAKDVVSGVAEGCRQAGCVLIGGETAEMPGMYPVGDYDLAGFSVGAVERASMIPRELEAGDILIGLPSSGVHSNGFSLVRRVMEISGLTYNDPSPFSKTNKTLGEELLTPTKIYVKSLMPLIKADLVKAFAHITGGGLLENIPRVLSKSQKVILNADSWPILPIFGWLASVGGINKYEMLRTFNCGIGGIIIVKKSNKDQVLKLLGDEPAFVVGQVCERVGDEEQVIVDNCENKLVESMMPFIGKYVEINGALKKRVAVLISGTGTNLQSLIKATQDPTKQMNSEIVLVISNKPNVYGLEIAQKANIPTVVIQHTNYKTREEFDDVMTRHLESAGVDIICLAGFMRILSEKFVTRWRGQLINIHPSLLPLFKGLHTQKQALEAGVKISGCTVHFVDIGVDTGAIICQEPVPILENDTEDDLTERIKTQAEQKAYPKALKLLASGKISLGADNKILYH